MHAASPSIVWLCVALLAVSGVAPVGACPDRHHCCQVVAGGSMGDPEDMPGPSSACCRGDAPGEENAPSGKACHAPSASPDSPSRLCACGHRAPVMVDGRAHEVLPAAPAASTRAPLGAVAESTPRPVDDTTPPPRLARSPLGARAPPILRCDPDA